LKALPKGGVGAEIGVFKGNMSAKLLRRAEPQKLFLIDPWRVNPDIEGGWWGANVGQEKLDEIYEGVRARFADEIAAGVVEIRRAESAQAAEEFPDAYFDWVYVDGNHLYEFVKQDLELYRRKVKPGGIVAGDDYGQAGWWEDGVTRAVDELLEQGAFEPLLLTSQFLLRVKDGSA
jgi:hypothetical protein